MTNGEFWEAAARRDPLWAILSDPSKKGRWELREFFETGRREISLLLYQLKQLGHPPQSGRALDFGCGVGRLSQALALHFHEVVGVDVSPTMIQLAGRLNHAGFVRYIENHRTDLHLFGPGHFDFIYSDIVLQHLDQDAARAYVKEFLRLLAPGGVAVFQLPSHRRTPEEQPPRPVHMPPDAYRAGIAVVDVPTSLAAGESSVATVEVENISTLAWNQSASGAIRLGNHWRDLDGTLLIQDDGRAQLPGEIPSGARLRLGIPIRAPRESGTFVCEFDLVHEAISWFADQGSSPTRVAVSVAGSESDAISSSSGGFGKGRVPDTLNYPDIYALLPNDSTDIADDFPMCGVPREEVLRLVDVNGGVPFLVEDDERGGPEWKSFRYFVCK